MDQNIPLTEDFIGQLPVVTETSRGNSSSALWRPRPNLGRRGMGISPLFQNRVNQKVNWGRGLVSSSLPQDGFSKQQLYTVMLQPLLLLIPRPGPGPPRNYTHHAQLQIQDFYSLPGVLMWRSSRFLNHTHIFNTVFPHQNLQHYIVFMVQIKHLRNIWGFCLFHFLPKSTHLDSSNST